jgi:cytochrome P450
MRDTIELECGIEAGGILVRWNPRRLYRQWKNGRTLNHLIGCELDKRYQEWQQTAAKSPSDSRSQSIMDLVIAEYMKTRPPQQALDLEFKRWATIQIRLFLFVGHDSEATTIIYALYLLSKHPEALAQLRAEHDRVFGPCSVKDVLQTQPETINQLSYTHAVIKETLRLFPPANGLRGGRPGVSLHDEQGQSFPTEGCAIWIVHPAVHRNSSSWPQPHAFVPDRWLVAPDHPLYPPAGGWRPFEHGARNCIGQNISLLGVKATLAMVVRQFDFHDAYAEYDRLHPSDGSIRTVFGERAYMIQKGAGHPAQGFPCKVTLRNIP